MAAKFSGVSTGGDYTALPQAILDVYSLDIQHEAQGVMRFREFAVEKTELDKQPGQTINMTKFNNIDRGGKIAESADIEEKAMSASQQAISVYEWANAIGVSEKLVRLAHLDGLKEAALLLGRDYAVTNDLMCRDCIAGASQVQYAGGRASRAALVGGTDYFDVEVIRLGVEILQTANAPKFNSDFYVCFVHPHQTAYLKRDPDWVSANNYANTRALFTGELGRWEDVVFIGTTHAQNGAANTSNPGYLAALKDAATGGSANASVYEALLFADSSFGVATALPVEMRDDGVRNFGRKHGIAWYSIEGAGILEDGFIVRIETV